MTKANSSFLEVPTNPLLKKLFATYTLLGALTDPVCWLLDKRVETILDIGCGQGYPMQLIKKVRNVKATGVDLFGSYLREAQKSGIYEKLINSDVTRLKMAPNMYDACICLQVIEHLPKEKGFKLIENMEKIAKHQVIITTPYHFFEHPDVDKNKLQRHLSQWSDSDFIKLGYKVKHVGLEILFGNAGLVHKKLPKVVRAGLFTLDKLLIPLYWFIPGFADYWIIAYKSP
jgi:SAM-dependent methyltransferase